MGLENVNLARSFRELPSGGNGSAVRTFEKFTSDRRALILWLEPVETRAMGVQLDGLVSKLRWCGTQLLLRGAKHCSSIMTGRNAGDHFKNTGEVELIGVTQDSCDE